MTKLTKEASNIPKNAKLVYKGQIFQVFQWKQKTFDGSFAIFENVKQAYTVNIIPVTKDGKIIITKQKQPDSSFYYGTVGGRMESGEKPRQTAKREMLEEIGYKSNKYTLRSIQKPFSKIDWVSYLFIAKNCYKVSDQKLDGGENIKLMYLSREEFIKKVTSRKFRNSEITLEILRTLKEKGKDYLFRKVFGFIN